MKRTRTMETIAGGEKNHGKQKTLRIINFMVNIEQIDQSDVEYKEEVIEQAEEAKKYLNSFSWCKRIISGSLVRSFGYILCIFLFEIEPTKDSIADDKLWVIVGDLPSAYLDTIKYKTSYNALDFYCFLMEEWIEHVRTGKSLDDCYPVNVRPTLEHANMLDTRIQLIKSDFLPQV
jgi:hypothetical protein